MEKSLFRYIWRYSKRDQIIICAVVLAQLPFYFASLDLPRRIVNEAIQGKAFADGQTTVRFLDIAIDRPSWLGGGTVVLFDGVQVDRMGLLLGLSLLFLLLVLINGGFKYWINVAKGALGERMLRRMRFQLFNMMLRFTPQAQRQVRSSETATVIKDEVEPIGGFIGDAFILPAFLGTQASTALLFIMVQNVWLGLLAGGMVAVQFIIIPRLRRELLRLGKQRQLASRRLAGRVSEIQDGIEIVHGHRAAAWERAEIGQRLYELFDIRFRIYRRKFLVKFLNNLLAQITPFFFYSIGGYFAITGRLDIGQLVAVIAAYRELPPPLKELIDWDQQRLDVQVKYDQVVQHFAAERLLPPETEGVEAEEVAIRGPLVVEDLRLADPGSGTVIDGITLAVPLPARVALMGDGGPAASAFARILARRLTEFGGTVRFDEVNLAALPAAAAARTIAYAGVEPILFPGTLRDNLVYGLRQRPLGRIREEARERARRISEATRTGNPVHHAADAWIDYERLGFAAEAELDALLIDYLHRVGMGEDLYRFGLAGAVDPARDPALAARLIDARIRLGQRFREQGMETLVEPFDPARYNEQATVAENLLFGVPTSRAFTGRSLAEEQEFREVLDRAGLTDDLVEMGMRIAQTMTEIFRGLPPGHPLFEQFSFLSAEELPEFDAIVRRRAAGSRSLRRDDTTRLVSLPLAYIEPRHRLGLLDDELRNRLVSARGKIRAHLEATGETGVAFYDPARINPAAPLKDNLLFGRVSHGVANAQAQVMDAVTAVVDELELRTDIERVGLDHQVGPAGRLLNGGQRAAAALVRCLVQRPDLLVLDGALAPFGEDRAARILAELRAMFQDRSLFVVVPNAVAAQGFDRAIRFRAGEGEVVERVRDLLPQGELTSSLAAE